MRNTNSILKLITSLLVVLLFVVGINLTTGNSVTADNLAAVQTSSQENERVVLPAQDEDEHDEDQNEEDENQGRDEEEGQNDDEDEDGEQDEEEGDQDDDEDMQDEDADEDEEDWDEEDGEQDEDDEHFEHMEMDRMEIESNIGRLETINRLAEIANDDTATASYAIMHLQEFIEDEDEAISILEELIKASSSKPVKNLLKMKLAEVYSWQDRREDALKTLKSLILSN